MNIIEAVKEAFKGKRIRRKSWFYIDKDRCNYVAGVRDILGEIPHLCQFYEGNDKEKKTAVFLDTDILAEDWEVIEDKEEV
jgi:hypothetical protein